jgi:TIR domain-containing protein
MMRKLVVFLSYAGEDHKLASMIANKLTAAFGRAVDLRYMSQFALGANFRLQIDEALEAADVMLVVATGREKLTHSFTGYEVGWFRRSQQNRPYIDEARKINRLIIPIAIFADAPAPLADIEGIGIGQADQFFFELVDGKLTGRKEDPFYKLLIRLDRILDKMDPTVERPPEQLTDDYKKYKEEADGFYAAVAELLSTLPFKEEAPKTRITVRLPADFDQASYQLNASVLFSIKGPVGGIFEKEPPPDEFLAWPDFEKFIGPREVALSWNDALTALVQAGVTGNFTDSDQIVFAHDRKRAFRLFVSKNTIFLDHSQVLDIHVISIMRLKDAGDPKTTFLSKGLEAGLRYRALFLEPNSPFAPVMFRFGEPAEFRRTVHDLLRELRLLLVRSDEAQLSDRHNLVDLFSSKGGKVDDVLSMIEIWGKQKDKLYAAAEKVLSSATPSYDDRKVFIEVLQEFCVMTRPSNRIWLQKILTSLEYEISADELADASAPPPKLPASANA